MPEYWVEGKVTDGRSRKTVTMKIDAPGKTAASRMFRAAQPEGSRVTRLAAELAVRPKAPGEKRGR
jgi:hypothetical protein